MDRLAWSAAASLGEFDCGAHEGKLELRVLSSEGFVAAVAPTHPLASRREIGLAELAEDTFVFLARDVCMYWFDQLQALCEQVGFTPRANREVGELGTQLTLVAAGLGVALVQESTRLARTDGIVYLPVREPTPPVASAVVWRADNKSPVLRHFLDVLPAQSDPVAAGTSSTRRSTWQQAHHPTAGSSPPSGHTRPHLAPHRQ